MKEKEYKEREEKRKRKKEKKKKDARGNRKISFLEREPERESGTT